MTDLRVSDGKGGTDLWITDGKVGARVDLGLRSFMLETEGLPTEWDAMTAAEQKEYHRPPRVLEPRVESGKYFFYPNGTLEKPTLLTKAQALGHVNLSYQAR
mgnify:CR=1 FL=1